MAKKSSENKKKNVNVKTKAKENTNKIVGWIAAIAALVMVAVIVIAVVLNNRGIDESYFVSDDTKYVMTIESDELMMEDEEEYAPDRVYVVYDYDEENVTGMRVYYEYADNATAKEAYDYARSMSDDEGDYEGFSLNGKYLVMEMESYNYDNLTVDVIKMLIEMDEADSQGADWSADGWTEVTDETDSDENDDGDDSDDGDGANSKAANQN